MRLHGMAEALKAQEQDPAARELSFLERLGLLVDQQWNWRENQALGAAVEDRQAPHERLCRRHRLSRRARTGQERDPRAGARSRPGCRITRTSSCSDQPASARASSPARWRRRRAATVTRLSTPAPRRCSAIWRWHAPTAVCAICWRGLSRIDVLVIDDWAMAPLSEPERRDFWEICEDRYQVRSTILTSQLPVTRWHEQIGDPTAGRRHPRPAGSQRPPHRDAWRFDAQESWEAERIAPGKRCPTGGGC